MSRRRFVETAAGAAGGAALTGTATAQDGTNNEKTGDTGSGNAEHSNEHDEFSGFSTNIELMFVALFIGAVSPIAFAAILFGFGKRGQNPNENEHRPESFGE